MPGGVEVGLDVGRGGGRVAWRQLYKNRSSRKIDFQRLFSREEDFPKTFSLTDNQFSGKTYFYTIRPGEGVDDADKGRGEDAGGAPLGLAPVPVAVDDLHDPGGLFGGVVKFHGSNDGITSNQSC